MLSDKTAGKNKKPLDERNKKNKTREAPASMKEIGKLSLGRTQSSVTRRRETLAIYHREMLPDARRFTAVCARFRCATSSLASRSFR